MVCSRKYGLFIFMFYISNENVTFSHQKKTKLHIKFFSFLFIIDLIYFCVSVHFVFVCNSEPDVFITNLLNKKQIFHDNATTPDRSLHSSTICISIS